MLDTRARDNLEAARSPSETWAMQTASDAMAEARRLDISLSAPHAERLARYIELLLRWNERLRLVGGRDAQTLIHRHLPDVLFLRLMLADRPGGLIDVGSGGGWPAIPLAIMCPNLELTLVESRQRKASFLRSASHELGLPIAVHAERLERLGPQVFDFATSLATFSPEEWLLRGRELLREGGELFVFAVRPELSTVEGMDLVESRRYELADGGSRCLLRYQRRFR